MILILFRSIKRSNLRRVKFILKVTSTTDFPSIPIRLKTMKMAKMIMIIYITLTVPTVIKNRYPTKCLEATPKESKTTLDQGRIPGSQNHQIRKGL